MIDMEDVVQTFNLEYKGKTAQLNSHNPYGFWKITATGIPKDMKDGSYTNADIAANRFKAWVDEEEFKEVNRNPGVAERHYNNLMGLESPKPAPKKKKKEPKVEITVVEKKPETE